MSVAQTTMNTHITSARPLSARSRIHSSASAGDQRIDEAADVPARAPAARRSGSIRRRPRSPRRRPGRRNNSRRRSTAASATAISTMPASDADERARSSAAEPPLARRILLDRRVERRFVEVGPQHRREQQLGISALPQQEIGQADLARGADQQVELGQAGGVAARPRSPLRRSPRARARRRRPWRPACAATAASSPREP